MSRTEREKLRRHHYATVGLCIACWIFILLAVPAMAWLEISAQTRASLAGTIFGGAIVLLLLQFCRRCPGCRANLGLRLRLGIPRVCGRCGKKLR